MEEARSHQNVETVEEVKNSVDVESNGTVPSLEEGNRDVVRLSRRRGGMSLYWIAVVGLLIVTLALLGVVVARRLSRGSERAVATLAAGSVSSSPSVIPAAASSVGPAAASSVSSASSSGVAVKAGGGDVLPEHEEEEEEEEEEEVVSPSVASKESEVVEERLEIAGLKVGEDGFSVPYVRGLKSDLLVTEDDEGILVALPHGLSMRFRPVAAGSFVMGSDDDDDGRSLQEDERDVTLTESYWLGEHEVTRGAWKAVMGCVSSSRDESDDCPMVFVNRNDAQAFCGALNDLYGESLPEGYVFGLPTVAQWEYAAGGGVEREGEAFSGGDILSEVAWHSGNSGGRLHRVGGKRPNQLGLYDMSGNAMEYCRDDISDELSELDPFGTVGRGWYGLRGGSYDCREAGCRVSSFALRYGRGGRFGVGGFRVGIVPAEEYGPDDDDDESDEDESEDEDESADAASAGEKGEKSDKKGESEKSAKKGESEKSDKKGESEKSDKKEERAKSGKSDKEDDSEKASKEDKKEDEKGKDGKKKRSRRSGAQLLRSRDSLDHSKARTIDLKRRKLLQTREQFSHRGEEDEEEKSEEGKGKDGKKKRSRRSSAQLLRSRDSLDHSKARTIDLKRRKLLQTREQQEEVRKAERKARREAKAKELAERKAKEKAAAAKAAKEKAKKADVESSRPSLFDVAKDEAAVPLSERSGLKLELVRVKGGKMVLGSPSGEVGRGGDEGQREVTLEDTYWLGKFEVSQEEFFEMMDFNPSLIRDEQLPVENVSWQDAKAFCDALNEHFEGRLPEGYVFDLPTEEEWEYASRCGELHEESEGIYSGIDDLEDIVWMGTSSGTTLPCEDLQANALGIYGMGGNVQEWCSTVCERDEYGEVRVVEGGNEGRYRAVRGGAWCFGSRKSRSAYRTSSLPTFRSNYVGFRVALVKRAVAPVKKALED